LGGANTYEEEPEDDDGEYAGESSLAAQGTQESH